MPNLPDPKTPLVLPDPVALEDLQEKYMGSHNTRTRRARTQFLSEIAGVFAGFPEVQHISLAIYTPWGFNDGDPSSQSYAVSINGHGEFTFSKTGVYRDPYEGYSDSAQDEIMESPEFAEAYAAADDEYVEAGEYAFYEEVYSKTVVEEVELPEAKEATTMVSRMVYLLDEAYGEGHALRFDRSGETGILTYFGDFDREH